MKKHISYILMTIFISSCGITTKDFYEYNNWGGTTKVEKIVNKRKKIRKLIVWNYTPSNFPNETIEKLINLKELSINSDTSIYLKIDAERLSSINNLRKLYVGTFSMDSFPKRLGNKNLKELFLSVDKLEKLNTDFSNLQKLKKMYIIMKDLKFIGEETKFPESLSHLIIYSKKIQSVPSHSLKNSNVTKITLWAYDMSNENVRELIETFEKIESLNKITILLHNCERKKYLLKTVQSKIKIKFKTNDFCNNFR